MQRFAIPGVNDDENEVMAVSAAGAHLSLKDLGPADSPLKDDFNLGRRYGKRFVLEYCGRFVKSDAGRFDKDLEARAREYVAGLSQNNQNFSAVYFRYGFEISAKRCFANEQTSLKRSIDIANLAKTKVAKMPEAKKPRLEVKALSPFDWPLHPVEKVASRPFVQGLANNGIFNQAHSHDVDLVEMSDIDEATKILVSMAKK